MVRGCGKCLPLHPSILDMDVILSMIKVLIYCV